VNLIHRGGASSEQKALLSVPCHAVTRVELAVGRAAGITSRGKEWDCCRLLRCTGSLEGYGVCVCVCACVRGWNADVWLLSSEWCHRDVKQVEKGGIF